MIIAEAMNKKIFFIFIFLFIEQKAEHYPHIGKNVKLKKALRIPFTALTKLKRATSYAIDLVHYFVSQDGRTYTN